MSRHRNVRNLTEDDYYDDYDYDDDYYDDDAYEEEDHFTQQQYAPPPKQTTVVSKIKTTTTKKLAVPGKTATTAAVGVTKPPPGWGKPSAPSSTPSAAKAGVSKPPAGWGVPSSNTTKIGGITTPPPGWGKPHPGGSTGTVKGVTAPPPGWGKPSNVSSSTAGEKSKLDKSNKRSISPKPDGRKGTYKQKLVPDVLKNTKSQLSMVVLGHVDAGKSTLMGQLLVQIGQISKRDANKQGNLSWLLDENESERERGVTMEIGTKSFSMPSHDIVILDAPGHADFIPIMITGAANADVAILVVAAVRGEFEAGFTGGGQTKEHVLLSKGLGVSQVIVAVNKLDVDGWSQARYEDIQRKVREYLLKQDFKPKRIRFIPLSGLTGENVKERKDPNLAWYKGLTLLEAIDAFQPAKRRVVTDIYAEGKGVIARGRVVQGFLEVGERVVVLPIGDTAVVHKLEHLQPPSDDLKRLALGMAGDTVDLVLTGIDIMRISVGNVLANPNSGAKISRKARAKLLVMDQLEVPIIRGAQVLFHMHSLDVPAVLNNLLALTKHDGSTKKGRPRALIGGASAIVELTLSDKIVMEAYSDCRALGRFVIRRSGDTIAIGLIDEVF